MGDYFYIQDRDSLDRPCGYSILKRDVNRADRIATCGDEQIADMIVQALNSKAPVGATEQLSLLNPADIPLTVPTQETHEHECSVPVYPHKICKCSCGAWMDTTIPYVDRVWRV